MRRHYIHLFIVALTLIILALISGCTQPDDISAPISTTRITFEPNQLPTLPDGYFFKLWVVDTADNYYSISKFMWNSELYRIYDIDTNLIDSIFTVEYDVLDPFYRYLALSVETFPDTIPDSIVGPVMLMDTIISPDTRPMKMVFPLDFGAGFAGFSVETPTDKDSYSQDASGIWFAYYTFDSMTVYDTLSVSMVTPPFPILGDTLVLHIDTTFWACDSPGVGGICYKWLDVTSKVFLDPSYPFDTLIVDSTVEIFVDDEPKYRGFIDSIYWRCDQWDGQVCVESTNVSHLFKWYDTLINPSLFDWVVYDTLLDTLGIMCTTTVMDYSFVPDSFNIDTFIHITMDFEYVAFPVNFNPTDTIDTFFIDSCTGVQTDFQILPLKNYQHNLSFVVDNISKIDTVDRFTPFFDEVPDLTGSKWHYKGWVLSPYLGPPYQPSDCSELGRLTPPAWLKYTVEATFSDPLIEELYTSPRHVPIISTGSFKSFGKADYTPNIYSDNKRVPFFPGEDFIRNLPCGAENYYFADPNNPDVSTGRVFVTIEPDNYTSNTNFPFVLFVSRYGIPNYDLVGNTDANYEQREDNFFLHSKGGTVPNSQGGFPYVNIYLVRE